MKLRVVPALPAVAEMVTRGEDLALIHPFIARQALQQLDGWPHTKGRAVRVLAGTLQINKNGAAALLETLEQRQHAPSLIGRLQSDLDAELPEHCWARREGSPYETAIQRFSRAQSQQLLSELEWVARRLHCPFWFALTDWYTPGYDTFDWTTRSDWYAAPYNSFEWTTSYSFMGWQSFMSRLVAQAGVIPRTRSLTSVVLETLTAEQAALLLRLQGGAAPRLRPEQGRICERVAKRAPGDEERHAHMDPVEAWHELCSITHRTDLYDAHDEDHGKRHAVREMLDELRTMLPDPHLNGLMCAAHIAADAPRRESVYVRTAEPGTIRSLLEMSAMAAGRVRAWQYLATRCDLGHLRDDMSVPARREVAAALIQAHPEGLDKHDELLADQALLRPHIEEHAELQLAVRRASRSLGAEYER